MKTMVQNTNTKLRASHSQWKFAYQNKLYGQRFFLKKILLPVYCVFAI